MKKLSRVLFVGLIMSALVAGLVGAQGPSLSDVPGSGWWGTYSVQNVGSGDATITAELLHMNPSDAQANVTVDVPSGLLAVGGSYTFFPFTEYGDTYMNAALNDGWIGGGTVQADQPIVAVATIANNVLPGAPVGVTGGYASAQYKGVDATKADTSISFPVVKNNYAGKSTTHYVQVVGAGPADISITYVTNDGSSYNDSVSDVESGRIVVFTPGDAGVPSEQGGDGTVETAENLGAASVSSSVALAGVYLEHPASGTATVLQATNGFVPADGDTTVIVPAVKSIWKGRTTAIQVQNVSGGPVDVEITYAYQNGEVNPSTSDTTTALADGAAFTFMPGINPTSPFDGPFGGGPDDEFLGGATIVATGEIVAIVNENNFDGTTQKQTTYACFPQSQATNSIAFPLVKENYVNKTTGIQVQNTSSTESATLTADYAMAAQDGTAHSWTVSDVTLDPGAAYTYYALTYGDSATYHEHDQTFGAVTIQSTGGAIVGIAQEADGYWAAYAGDTKNYEGFNQ